MKSKQLIFSLLICLLAWAKGFSQTALICNDLISVTLDQGCTHTVNHTEILEGTYCLTCDYTVQIDTLPPFGNGPWIPAVLDISDLGHAYQIRVTENSTQNKCWGNIKVVEELECNGVTIVNLPAGAPVDLSPSALQIDYTGDCFVLDPVTSTMNGLSTIPYDCNDLGVHIIQVVANDQFGNAASCYTTVVVDDPASECSTCISCPPATTVTTVEGTGNLLQAYQSGDLAAFDNYGQAVYNNTCTFADSTYSVDYQTSGYGQNWFVRYWEGKDGNGQVTAACQQVIIFPATQYITVSGKTFIDSIPDCQYTAGEPGISIFHIVATKFPSNVQTIAFPNNDGTYAFNLDVNGLDTSIRIQYVLPPGLNSSCPTTLDIPVSTAAPDYTFNIGLQSEQNCPLMQVNMEGLFMRRCFSNTFYVEYCNTGLQTAENAYITIQFDTLFQVLSSSIPWTSINGNEYTFSLGDVPKLTCGTFQVNTYLSCQAVIGQTLCNGATIYPNTPCEGSVWGGPFIETTAYCNGDTVSLAVWNTGAQAMTIPKQYIVIEDVIMYKSGDFQLGAGDSITIKMPANGSTWRIEAEQVNGYPVPDEPSAAVEACGGLNNPGLVNAFPANDGALFYDRYCDQVRGSCDPNDKSAVPTGYGEYNTIRANTDLEYKIRFQNTGTDTAFRVVIVDTLSPLLNAATIEAGASSNPYRLDVFPGGILHFVFDPIALPDSNVNEVASHGFVKFRIAQQPDLPDGAVITNNAAIYFDFNEAVVTNTVFHTIGKPFVSVDVDEPTEPGVMVDIRPNPFQDRSTIEVSGTTIKEGLFTLFDAQGKTLYTQAFEGNQFELERKHLNQGLYFFRISAAGKPLASGKLQAY